MSNSKSVKNPPRLTERYSVRNAVLNYYLTLMFTVFPLFATDRFFNIRHDKYYFFLALTGIVLIAEVMMILNVNFSAENQTSPQNEASTKVWYKNISITDWAMIAFLVSCIISTILSHHSLDDNLFGTAGRNNGLMLIVFYVGIYFIITRCFYYMDYVFLAFAGGSAVVFLLAVLNFHYIDPLGMYVELGSNYIEDFTSTIGNKNLLSSYICVSLPVFIAMSVHTKKTLYRAVYMAVSALGFMALMTADSDSGILGMGVFLAVFFVWYSRKIHRLKYYFLNITIMLASAKVLKLLTFVLTSAFGCKTKQIDDFQKIFVESNIGFILIIAFAVITAVLFLIDYKKPQIVLSKAVPIILGVFFGLAAIGILCVVFYFSVIDTETDLGSFSTLMRFNEKWGTHRGFMWIKSFEIFGDFSFIEKLFGTGPDTFSHAFSPYFNELMKYGDSSTNAAHNEYINYLITIGLVGLLSYLAVVGSCIVRAVKTAKKNPIAIVFVSAVICYSVQAFVNISQPITTPLFIIFIALTEAVSMQRNKAIK